MSRRTTKYLKAALTALHYSGAGDLLAPLTGGLGAIFMLHQVGPEAPAAFSPNRILKISPAAKLLHMFAIAAGFGTTNVAAPFTNWARLGSVPEISPGQFQYTDSAAPAN